MTCRQCAVASFGVHCVTNRVNPPLCDVSVFDSINISENDVLAAINMLKNNLSAGPDELPPLLFKRIKYSILSPLNNNFHCFRQLLSVAYIPDEWKRAVITPVHKKSPTHLLTNYRPISVTCVPCKLLERIVASKVYSHLYSNNVLSGDQHGFVRGRSTYLNLLECLNEFTNNMQDKCKTVVIY